MLTSRVAETNILALRTAETIEALLKLTALFLALSRDARSPATLQSTIDALAKRLPRARGERGPRGEKGEPGIVPTIVSTKIDEHYNLVVLRAGDLLEIIPLREAFERYHAEVNGS